MLNAELGFSLWNSNESFLPTGGRNNQVTRRKSSPCFSGWDRTPAAGIPMMVTLESCFATRRPISTRLEVRFHELFRSSHSDSRTLATGAVKPVFGHFGPREHWASEASGGLERSTPGRRTPRVNGLRVSHILAEKMSTIFDGEAMRSSYHRLARSFWCSNHV